jgi:hypothetical protein
MDMGYAVRPQGMERIGPFYFPDGVPKRGSSFSPYCSASQDAFGEVFYICYTEAQINAQVGKRGFFSPYMPLYCTGPA